MPINAWIKLFIIESNQIYFIWQWSLDNMKKCSKPNHHVTNEADVTSGSKRGEILEIVCKLKKWHDYQKNARTER